jgi:hypothetical protein
MNAITNVLYQYFQSYGYTNERAAAITEALMVKIYPLVDDLVVGERLACAQVAEEHARLPYGPFGYDTEDYVHNYACRKIAEAIRARGES